MPNFASLKRANGKTEYGKIQSINQKFMSDGLDRKY